MNYFYVYQNKTYNEERQGSFLWSPKFASGWARNAGYETMKQVKTGDIILHSFKGEIVAVSIAQSSCYTSPRPSGAFAEWANDGWRIDVKYFVLSKSLKVSPFIPDLYKMQPMNGPYTSAYRGKQQYLCNCNKAVFDYLFNKILASQYGEASRNALRSFVGTGTSTEHLDVAKTTVVKKEVEHLAVEVDIVVDNCVVYAKIVEQNKPTKFTIDINKYKKQKVIIGKKIGDNFKFKGIPLTYKIEKIVLCEDEL